MTCTRRTFLERVGQTGGGVAVHRAMQALGLAGRTCAGLVAAHRTRARRRARHHPWCRRRGLAAAYELRKLGYECEILEARPRFGGRCFTVRGGQASEEIRHRRRRRRSIRTSTSTPAPHVFLTITPPRSTIVGSWAWRSSRSAASTRRLTSTSRRPCRSEQRLRLREMRADWRGQTSELLAKAVTSGRTGPPVSRGRSRTDDRMA